MLKNRIARTNQFRFFHRVFWLLVFLSLLMSEVAVLGAPQAVQTERVSVGLYDSYADPSTPPSPELRRWLTGFLAEELSVTSRSLAVRPLRRRPRAQWTAEELSAVGQESGVEFVVAPGLRPVVYERGRGVVRTRIQLYADLVSVQTGSMRRLDVTGVDPQKDGDADTALQWDSVSPGASDFLNSSFGRALTSAFKKLAVSINKEIESELAGTPTPAPTPADASTPEPQPQLPTDAAESEDAAQVQSDEELQQLIAQAQECLNSMNASGEKLTALIQAIEGLKSALEVKARLLEEGKIGETDRVDQEIDAQRQALEQAEGQILPEDPGDAPLPDDIVPGEVPGSGEGKLDKAMRVIDFALGVVERITDLRSRFRGLSEEPYPAEAYYPGADPGYAPVEEEPFIEVDGNVMQEDEWPRGRLLEDRPRPRPAMLTVTSGHDKPSFRLARALFDLPRDASTVTAASSRPASMRRRPVAGAEIVEPDSGASTRTDSTGYYSLRVPARSTRLIVRMGGRQLAERRISLASGRVRAADFVVRPGSSAGASDSSRGRVLPSRVIVDPTASNTGAVGGVVEDAGGSPVPRAMVELRGLAAARTDSRGRFVFNKVPSGAHQLIARGGERDSASEQVSVGANRTAQLTMRLGAGRRSQSQGDRLIAPGADTVLRGSVADNQGRPVAGARISVIGPATTVAVNSNGKGDFQIRDLKAGSYRVLASKVGYDDAGQSLSLRAGDTKSLDLKLGQSNSRFDRDIASKVASSMGQVRGQVRGPNKTPVANATIELTSSSKTLSGARTATDARGQYSIKAFQGRYEVKVSRTGFEQTSRAANVRAGETTSLDFDLNATSGGRTGSGPGASRKDGQLRGRVTDDKTGRPIAGAVVLAQGQSDSTDSGGNYAIANLAPGKHQVSVRSANYSTETGAVEIKPGSPTSRDFKLTPKPGGGTAGGSREDSGQLRGRVTDDRTGRPIAGAVVSTQGQSDSTDSGGNYAITNLAPGKHQVSVRSANYSSETSAVEIKPGSSTSRDFKLTPKPGGATASGGREGTGQLRGRVTDDKTGRPIAGAIVSLQGRSDATDTSGQYAIANIQPGKHRVNVTSSNYSTETDSVEVRAESTTTKNFELRARSGAGSGPASGSPRKDGQLSGRVTDDQTGRPISGARVSVGGRSDTTDQSGRYNIDGIATGRHEVSVSRSGYYGERATVEIRAGSATSRNFDLKPASVNKSPRSSGALSPGASRNSSGATGSNTSTGPTSGSKATGSSSSTAKPPPRPKK